MITFKQFLSEKAMNRGEFAKTELRQSAKAKVGFEFEMVIPKGSNLIGGTADDRDMLRLSRIDQLDEIVEYFNVSISDRRHLESEFDDWKDKRKARWIEDNAEYSDEEEEEHGRRNAEALAAERAADEYDAKHSGDASFIEFVDDEYGDVYKLVNANGYDPMYGWASDTGSVRSATIYTEPETEDGERQFETFKNVASDLEGHLGVEVVDDEDRSGDLGAGRWVVTADGSIKADGGVGVELISPPLPLGEALKALKETFQWMRASAVTNDSTGFHINVSLPNIENIDPVKLVLFTGETHVLKAFMRLTNHYTQPQKDKIITTLTTKGTLPKEASELIALAKSSLSNAKYSAINVSKLGQGYIEFRMAGNHDYHKNFDLVKDTVLRFVTALELAVDPQAERKEYLKKVSKLLGDVEEASRQPRYEGKSLIQLLEIRGKDPIIKLLNDWTSAVKSGKMSSGAGKERVKDWVEDILLPTLSSMFLELKLKPTDKHKAELKLILKRLGLDSKDFPEAAESILKP